MDDLGIKIGSVETKTEEKNVAERDKLDYSLDVSSAGSALLERIKNEKKHVEAEVVYGVYDNRNAGFLSRLNDFFIDHSKITLKDKSYFFHMLAVMVDAGIPVVQAVKSLSGRTENPRFRRILLTVAYNCEHGATLSEAMARFESVFDELEIGIVKSGEATGKLNQMLFKLSHQLDKRSDLNSKLWAAAVYPLAVLCVLFLVAIAMLVWVFPTLLNLLNQGGVDGASLPFATRLLVSIQGFIVGYWWATLLGAVTFYGLFLIYTGGEYGKARWDYFKLKFPLVGTLLRKVAVLRFISMLGLLIESGLPVMQSLKIAGNSVSNSIYKLKFQEIINSVKAGKRISDSLQDAQFLFPAEVVQMLAVGEASANLSKISEKIAEQYDREIDGTMKKLSSVFEPMMILFVGLFVALLALAIMAPIFNLSSIAGA